MSEVQKERESPDLWLLTVATLLLGLGVAAVLDASMPRAEQAYQDFAFFGRRQAIFAALSLGMMGFFAWYPYWKLKRWTLWGILGAIILLVLVLFLGKEVNGSKRWFDLGPVRFQPSEFAKIALVVALARYGEIWKGKVRHLIWGFTPAVLLVGIVGVLVAKEDLGTAITILVTGVAMIFLMGARPSHFLILLGIGLMGLIVAIAVEPYRIQRVLAWLQLLNNPVEVHSGPAYQPAQGLIALGSGGVTGVGVMRGGAKHLYLPAEHTDYIFAALGEEIGLIGCSLLVLAFALLVVRGLHISHRTTNWFGSLTAAGLTMTIGVQALLNVAVVTGVVPCTGVPLPFISYGGSSLVFTAISVGILLNISQFPEIPVTPTRRKDLRERRVERWRHRRTHLSGA